MELKSPTKRGTKPNTSKPKNNKLKNKKDLPLKVVYISSPMKVKTSASGFRALVQRLTGKGAVWPLDPSDLESLAAHGLGDSQTGLNNHNGTIINNIADNVSIISDDHDTGVMNDSGVEFPAADLSPDTSAASDDLHFQPLDHDCDDVLLMDRDMPVFNDHDFACLIQSDGLDFFDQLLI